VRGGGGEVDGGFDDGDWLWIGYDWRPVLGIQSVRHDLLISNSAVSVQTVIGLTVLPWRLRW